MSKTRRPSDNPKSLEEWLFYLKRYEHGIYVPEQVDGHRCNVALADLTPERWAYWVARWLKGGVLPCRLKEPGEMKAK